MINKDKHLIAIEKMIKDATLPGRQEIAFDLYNILVLEPVDTAAAIKKANDLLHGAKSSRSALTELISDLEGTTELQSQQDLGLDQEQDATTERSAAKMVFERLREQLQNPSETLPKAGVTVEGVGPDQPIVTNAQGGRQSDTPYCFNDLDPQAMLAIAKRSGYGLKKYGPLNWTKIGAEEHLNHALAHIYAWMAGDRSDTIAGRNPGRTDVTGPGRRQPMNYVMPIPKNKRQRLKGKALAALNEAIHERDNYICIVPGCGRHVPLGVKFHHEPCGKDKEDRIDKGVLLCYEVHHPARHFGPNGEEIREICEDYLAELYQDGRAAQ